MEATPNDERFPKKWLKSLKNASLSILQACNLETNLKMTFSARTFQEFSY